MITNERCMQVQKLFFYNKIIFLLEFRNVCIIIILKKLKQNYAKINYDKKTHFNN